MTISTLGMYKIPSDVNECVKVLVYEELLVVIKKMLKERSCEREKENLKESEALDMNNTSSSASTLCHLLTPDVTPPPTPANLQSVASSPDHVNLITTPLPTPPPSPTLSVQQMADNSMESESNRIPTPKSSLGSTSNNDIDSLMHDVQPEITVNSSLSTPSMTQLTISTSVHTPQESSNSSKKPPAEEETATKQTTK